MTDHTNVTQHTGIHTLMKALKNKHLIGSFEDWNKKILIQITDQDDLCYGWIIRDGRWKIAKGKVQFPDLIVRGTQAQFINDFTEGKVSVELILPGEKDPWLVKDQMKYRTLVINISMILKGKTSSVIAEGEALVAYIHFGWDGKFCRVEYPSIIFPDKCVVCGNPKEVVQEEMVSSIHVLSKTSYEKKSIDVKMKIEIPLCKDHKKEIQQSQMRLVIGMLISAILGSILGSIVGLMFQNAGIEGIFYIVLGGIVGLLVMGAVVLFSNGIRRTKNKVPLFWYEPYKIEIKDEAYEPTARISIRVDNIQIQNEIVSLTNKKGRSDKKVESEGDK